MNHPTPGVIAMVVGACLLGPLGAGADVRPSREGMLESKVGTWTPSAHAGIVFDTPDGTAPQFTGSVERFLTEEISIGPMVQTAFTGDLAQFGVSGQVKYWMDIADAVKDSALVFQAGIGFIHADVNSDDTSWLIPLGMGIDYALNEEQSLTADLLVSFTDLHTGRGSNADVMPAIMVGLRF